MLAQILLLTVERAADLAERKSVCRRFRDALAAPQWEEAAWRQLTRRRWVFVNPAMPVRSWRQYYRTRLRAQASLVGGLSGDACIENCLQWEMRCPLTLRQLEAGGTTSRDAQGNLTTRCAQCDREVYHVTNTADLLSMHIKFCIWLVVYVYMCLSDGHVLLEHVEQKHCVVYLPKPPPK